MRVACTDATWPDPRFVEVRTRGGELLNEFLVYRDRDPGDVLDELDALHRGVRAA